MNKKLILLGIGVLLLQILMASPVPLVAATKSKNGSNPIGKEQKITVTAIDSEELNFCGNRMGGFGAKFQGKTIRIIFGHDQHSTIVPNLKLSDKDYQKLFCAEKLSFVNSSFDVIGVWAGNEAGVDYFQAQKIIISNNLASQSSIKIEDLKIPYEDIGACPFECCTYRERTANKEVVLRGDRKGNSPILFRIKKGEKVVGITGVVITTQPGRARVKRSSQLVGMGAKPGDIVYLLSYKGEGIYKAWFRGRIINEFSEFDDKGVFVEVIEKPKSIWWVQIKNARGQTGWTNETENFNNKDACGG